MGNLELIGTLNWVWARPRAYGDRNNSNVSYLTTLFFKHDTLLTLDIDNRKHNIRVFNLIFTGLISATLVVVIIPRHGVRIT